MPRTARKNISGVDESKYPIMLLLRVSPANGLAAV